MGLQDPSVRALDPPCWAQPTMLQKKFLSSSVTILRERKRRQSGWFKLVLLVWDSPFKSSPHLRKPFPELSFPKMCSMEHEAQKVLHEERVLCEVSLRTALQCVLPSEIWAHLLGKSLRSLAVEVLG